MGRGRGRQSPGAWTATLAGAAALLAGASGHAAPAADHHVHLRSARASALLAAHRQPSPNPSPVDPHDAAQVLAILDKAGIAGAVVVSDAYRLAAPGVNVPNAADEVRRENAWTAAEVAKAPRRLTGFCSVNPLADDALDAVTACRAAGLTGLKLHLANSRVDLDDTAQVRQVREVITLADRLRMPLLIHLRNRRDWDPDQAVEVFLRDLLPAATHVPIQLAHLGGWGGFDHGVELALDRFAAACGMRPVRCRRLYFDLAAVFVAGPMLTAAGVADRFGDPGRPDRLADDMRRIGLSRFVFGSDFPFGEPGAYATVVAAQLPLRRPEVERVMRNRAPWMAGRGF